MHNPVRVAGFRVFDCQLLVDGNHARALRIEEGRTRPGHATTSFPTAFNRGTSRQRRSQPHHRERPLPRQRAFTTQRNRSEDMIMESLHD